MRSSSSKFILAFFIAACANRLFALESSPDYFLFKGAPGKKIKHTLTLKNNDAAAQKIALGFEPKVASADGSLISFSRAEFELKSGESKDVAVICRVPQKQGEIFGNLLIRSVPQSRNSYEIRMKPEVCVQIEGTRVSGVAFAGVSASRKGGNLWVQANLRNVGNVKVIPKLVAQLGNQKEPGAAQVLNSEKDVFYPNEQAAFTGALALPGASSKYERVLITAFYHAANGRLEKKTESFIVEALP